MTIDAMFTQFPCLTTDRLLLTQTLDRFAAGCYTFFKFMNTVQEIALYACFLVFPVVTNRRPTRQV